MLLPTRDRRISRVLLFVVISNIKQIMRKKVLFILAVPILFLMSLFFLMSDIKNIPDNSVIESIASPNFMERPGKQERTIIKKGEGVQTKPAPPPVTKEEEFSTTDPPKKPDSDYNNEKKNNERHNNKATKEKSKSQQGNGIGDEQHAERNRYRQKKVKDGYLHAWHSYERFVFGRDELKPQSKTSHDWLGMGLTIVDSIDTMYLMGLHEEYEKGRSWIEANLDFDSNANDISLFETTIRVVGGLLSIYDMTEDSMFLGKARALGEKLMPAFNTISGIPYTTINLRTGYARNPQWAGDASILSEAGTLQLEFATLSKHTKVSEFGEKAVKVYDVLDSVSKPGGLYPVFVDPGSGTFRNNRVTLGALGDSFYEYLLKYWIMTGKKNEKYRRMYDEATQAIISQLVKRSTPSQLVYIAEKEGSMIVDKMDHLVCFAGAMFALGAYHNATKDVEQHLELGKQITRTCHEFYVRQRTGLGPEIVRFSANDDFHVDAHHYILRPETVESYYVLYWITGDPIYQDWGWEAFQAIETHCNTPDGYCGVRDVTMVPADHDDLQQSFFMAETLKYLYLLFSPRDTVPLDKWVFNTEAHPLKVWDL